MNLDKLPLVRQMLESNLRTAQQAKANALHWIGSNMESVGVNPHAIAGSATDLARNLGRIEAYETALSLLETLEEEA